MLLVYHFVYDFKAVFLGKACCDHRLLEFKKCLSLFLLNILEPPDQLLLHSLQLLSFSFEFVNQLLLVVCLSLDLSLAQPDFGVAVILYRLLGLLYHLFDRLSLLLFTRLVPHHV